MGGRATRGPRARAARRSWTVFWSCAALALLALVWLSAVVWRLEASGRQAEAEARRQEALRLALWRMDSWMGLELAREAARPYFEYLSFFPTERTYTRMLQPIVPGEVLFPSPLLTERADWIRLHFQVGAGGRWSSPQVPAGNLLDLVQDDWVGADELERARAELAALSARVDPDELRRAVGAAVTALEGLLAPGPAASGGAGPVAAARRSADGAAGGPGASAPAPPTDADARNQLALSKRAWSNLQAQQSTYAEAGQLDRALARDPQAIEAGPFVPIWLGEGDATLLCFARRVRAGGDLLQGFLASWGDVRAALLAQVEDLFATATLAAVRSEPGERRGTDGLVLASIPAVLEGTLPPAAVPSSAGSASATLAVAWFAALVALVAVGVTLRSSLAFAEQRGRFASAVTHELRTPLTTFRMYTEMLANDMVPGPQRAEYLSTLERESARLSNLVENVMSFARLEDGRACLHRERVAVAALLERARPALEERARVAGAELALSSTAPADRELECDADAVAQILFNLVDNACKYGLTESERTVAVEAACEGGDGPGERLVVRVSDRGAGVPQDAAGSVFRPFERGDREPAGPHPGVGLGLALARGFARDLGGDLVLEPRAAGGRGATFRLELPLPDAPEGAVG